VIARQNRGLTRAPTSRNICNEAAIHAGRHDQDRVMHVDFDAAMERVVAGLQQRKVVTEKEKQILAYHEGGHAVMSHLMGDAFPVHKATIIARGQALGYTLNLPAEDRYLHTKEELGRLDDDRARRPAAEQNRVRQGHERRAQRPREGDRHRALDGVRVGHVGNGHVADDAGRQLRRSPRRRSGFATPSRVCSPTRYAKRSAC